MMGTRGQQHQGESSRVERLENIGKTEEVIMLGRKDKEKQLQMQFLGPNKNKVQQSKDNEILSYLNSQDLNRIEDLFKISNMGHLTDEWVIKLGQVI